MKLLFLIKIIDVACVRTKKVLSLLFRVKMKGGEGSLKYRAPSLFPCQHRYTSVGTVRLNIHSVRTRRTTRTPSLYAHAFCM